MVQKDGKTKGRAMYALAHVMMQRLAAAGLEELAEIRNEEPASVHLTLNEVFGDMVEAGRIALARAGYTTSGNGDNAHALDGNLGKALSVIVFSSAAGQLGAAVDGDEDEKIL